MSKEVQEKKKKSENSVRSSLINASGANSQPQEHISDQVSSVRPPGPKCQHRRNWESTWFAFAACVAVTTASASSAAVVGGCDSVQLGWRSASWQRHRHGRHGVTCTDVVVWVTCGSRFVWGVQYPQQWRCRRRGWDCRQARIWRDWIASAMRSDLLANVAYRCIRRRIGKA